MEERETTAVIRPGWTASVLADGSLLVSDDHGGRIYRVRYTAP